MSKQNEKWINILKMSQVEDNDENLLSGCLENVKVNEAKKEYDSAKLEYDKADKLYKALDICTVTEKKYVITGRDTGATCEEFGDYVMNTLQKL